MQLPSTRSRNLWLPRSSLLVNWWSLPFLQCPWVILSCHPLSSVQNHAFLVHFKACRLSHGSWLFSWSQDQERPPFMPRLWTRSTWADIWSWIIFPSSHKHYLHPLSFSPPHTHGHLYIHSGILCVPGTPVQSHLQRAPNWNFNTAFPSENPYLSSAVLRLTHQGRGSLDEKLSFCLLLLLLIISGCNHICFIIYAFTYINNDNINKCSSNFYWKDLDIHTFPRVVIELRTE